MKVMDNLYYTKDHEWLKIEGKIGYVGIADYAQDQLGSIVFVELPEEDDEIEAGEAFGAIESVKAATDIYAPVDGTVVECNYDLEDEPELINEDCYENWIIKIKIDDESQKDDLMNADEYKEYLETLDEEE
ncbi:MAG TPA: glycine cleavage system protein GcvH [Clostridiales bacterium]|jgi:glycine cleavage system H protein|nr:glycine cleavage system protein GcvH [Clostridiales bacterium]